MSIASEYAARLAAAKIEPESFYSRAGERVLRAGVTDEGNCYVSGSASPGDALKLAAWIIKTFSDVPATSKETP